MINNTDFSIASFFFRAIAQKRVTLAFQPIVHCGCFSKILYEEALLRIHGVDRLCDTGLIIKSLERQKMIQQLDCMVVSAALRALEQDLSLRVGCNLSALSLAKGKHWKTLIHQLSSLSEVAPRLTLEITETAFFCDFDDAVERGKELKSIGCRVAIDDFGLGKKRIEFAQTLSVDVIKIDANFLWAARYSEEAMRKLWALTILAQSISPEVVIEGIEENTDIQIAAKVGLQWFQGFGISRPTEKNPSIVIEQI